MKLIILALINYKLKMLNTLETIISASLITSLQSNSSSIYSFIPYVIVFFYYVFLKLDTWTQMMRTLCEKKFKYTVKVLSYESSNPYRPKTRSTLSYNAVTYYIKDKYLHESQYGISNITENYYALYGNIGDSYKNHDDTIVQQKIGYDITQPGAFFIEDGIYCKYETIVKEQTNLDKEYVKLTHKYLHIMSNKNMNHIDTFIKCMSHFDKYMQSCLSKGPFIFTYKGTMKDTKNTVFDEKYFKSNQTLDNSIFDNKPDILSMLSKFNDTKYYQRHTSLTQKIVLLCHGEPGTGKTFTIRLVAKELKRHVVIVPLNKIKTIDELNSVLFFKKINDYDITPEECIFVFEDLDAMTDLLSNRNENKNIKKQHVGDKELIKVFKKSLETKDSSTLLGAENNVSITMSDILNLLDGTYMLHNYVITFSTNHIDKLDPAFLRDQRITHNIEFRRCSKSVLIKIIETWFSKPLESKYKSKLKMICCLSPK